MSRLETGVVQLEGDWPGVFIRGDNVGSLVALLRCFSDADPRFAEAVEREIEFFRSCAADLETREVLDGTAQKVKAA